MKICLKCGEEKVDSEFRKRKASKDGLDYYCKTCCKSFSKDMDKEKRKIYDSKYYSLNKKNILKRLKTTYSKEKSRIKNFRNYGLTVEAYNSMILYQEGKCAICGEETNLVIDHCHLTSKVRGLLCNLCNTGLGLFKENKNSLRRAIEYLDISMRLE